ncbi:hypothetical protein Hanom_Chr16g01487511 [Helianthus anomalus]
MVLCMCGKQASLRTPWSDCNPFYACPDQELNCGFFDYIDLEMSHRSIDVIHGLIRGGRNMFEEQLRERGMKQESSKNI